MRAPSAQDVVRAWEVGEARPAWFRGLLLLSLGAPAASFGELARLSLGQRNTRIAALRRVMFGEALTALCSCPRCGAVAEFTAGVDDLAPGLGAEERPRNAFLVVGGEDVTCRAPTSEDLAELEGAATPAGATDRTALVLRCLGWERPPPAAATRSEASLMEAVVEGWHTYDPGFETTVELGCDSCGHDWTFSFDWPSFVWAELAAAARRLMGEVAALARAFGWRESDVLELGAARRRIYLDQAVS